MSTARVNGISIEYELFGPPDGVPLLLIHGYAEQSISWPEEWIAGFTRAGYKIIVYDNRDTGFSQKWHGLIPDFAAIMAALKDRRKPDVPYTLSDMAADAAGLLDALGIEAAHVVGASMGGMIAQVMALEHRAKLRSLTLVYSTAGDLDLPKGLPEAVAALLKAQEACDRETVIANVLASRRTYGSRGIAVDQALIAEHAGRCYDRMYYPEGAKRHWSAILVAPPRGRHLRRLDLPTLVLHGLDDTLILPEHGRRLAEIIPGAEHHEIAGWGHDLPPAIIPRLHELIVPFLGRADQKQ